MHMLTAAVGSLFLLGCTSPVECVNFRIGGLAAEGNAQFVSRWTATFSTFLNDALSDKGYTFELVPLNYSTLYAAVERSSQTHPSSHALNLNTIDFVFANPSIFSCLESEYGVRAIASRNTMHMGVETSSIGGSFIARHDRDDLATLEDIKDKVVEAASISSLAGFQMQWLELQRQGIELLMDPRELRFANNRSKVAQDVISGYADIGLIHAGDYGGVNPALFKVLEPKDLGPNSKFPFQTSTALYPDWPVAALRHVPESVSKAMVTALFHINQTHEAAVAGEYSSWILPLSYASLNDMQESLGWITKPSIAPLQSGSAFTAFGQCVKPSNFYNAVVCPVGHVKVWEEEMGVGCAGAPSIGVSVATTACPSEYTCICKPCKKVPDVEFTISIISTEPEDIDQQQSFLTASSSAVTMQPCEEKLMICAKGMVGHQVVVVVQDNWQHLRNSLALHPIAVAEVKFHGDNDIDIDALWVKAELTLIAGTFFATFISTTPGSHLLEVKVNGEQVQSSPVLVVTVGARDLTSAILGATLGTIIGIILLSIGGKLYYDYRQARKPVDFQAAFDQMVATGAIALPDGDQAMVPREIRRRDLDFIERLDGGVFGDVWKATLDESHVRGNPSFTVAAKTVIDPQNHPEGTQNLISEAAIMIHVSNHPNLVSIIGVITSGEPMVLILQFCEHGSSLQYVKTKFAAGDEVSHSAKMIMAIDVATGMDFLGSRKLIHRDLAARNVLLATGHSLKRQESMAKTRILRQLKRESKDSVYLSVESTASTDQKESCSSVNVGAAPFGEVVDETYLTTEEETYLTAEAVAATREESISNYERKSIISIEVPNSTKRRTVKVHDPTTIVAKVADFGLSRSSSSGKNESYYKSSNGVFPVRWTSPEAMETLKFSPASDCWSFGIFVIELLQDGEYPYQGLPNPGVMKLTMSGERHHKPPKCPNPLYTTLLECWHPEASLRPTFAELVVKLCSHAQEDKWPLLAAVVASLRFARRNSVASAEDKATRVSVYGNTVSGNAGNEIMEYSDADVDADADVRKDGNADVGSGDVGDVDGGGFKSVEEKKIASSTTASATLNEPEYTFPEANVLSERPMHSATDEEVTPPLAGATKIKTGSDGDGNALKIQKSSTSAITVKLNQVAPAIV